jgi:large subunit ribosomal protein L22
VAVAERQEVRAEAKYVRASARKARLVLEHVRGRTVPEARTVLAFSERAVATDIEKVLKSAVANAEANHGLIGDELVVVAAYADEGPTIKRWRPRARGRATRIRKRTCHITIIVARLTDTELQERRRREGGAATQRRRGVIPGRRRKAAEAATTESAAPKAGKGKAAETAAPEEEAPQPEAAVEAAPEAAGEETLEERVAPYVADADDGADEEAAPEGEAAPPEEEEGK